jgi:hypothetical protein
MKAKYQEQAVKRWAIDHLEALLYDNEVAVVRAQYGWMAEILLRLNETRSVNLSFGLQYLIERY